MRVSRSCVCMLFGLATAACHASYGPHFPADMATPLPSMTWQSGPGMPQGAARTGMPIVLATQEHAVVGFGGSPTTQADTWSFSLKDDAWSTLILGTTPPPGRTGHCAAYLPTQNEIVFAGGHDDSGTTTATLTFLVGTPGFTLVADAPAPSGCAAAYHAVSHQAVIFGGTRTVPTNETWLFDGTAFTQASPASAPSPRSGASLVVDPDGDEMTMGRLLLFGGLATNGESADLWLWDGGNWGELPTQEDPNATATDDPRPVGRRGAAVAVDPQRRVLYVFGGTKQGTILDDLWRLDLGNLTWSRLHLDGGPVGRFDASVAYDSIVDRMLIFGGTGDAGPLADGWALQPVQ